MISTNLRKVNDTNPAERLREGGVMSGFVVKAAPGFTVTGRHKFNLRRRGNRIYAEYCRTCSAARRMLRIEGENVDYVQKTLDGHKGWSVEGFKRNTAQMDFTAELIGNYKRLGGK